MKGIKCCGECAYYNMKKHKCTGGAEDPGKAEDSFYTDCPHVEAEPVRHGRWIQSDALDYKDPNGVIHVHGMCSCCRLIYDFRDMTSRFKFCPNCGADMREGGADNG